MSLIRRLPIRVRLTLASAVVTAVVLAGVTLVLYANAQAGLNESIDDVLDAHAADLTAMARLVGVDGLAANRRPLPTSRASSAQILAADGGVLATTRDPSQRPLLSPDERRRAAQGRITVTRGDSTRLLAQPFPSRTIVVVGVDLGQREHTLATIRTGLLIGGPIALILVSLAAYGLAGGALRPVEAMRQRAAGILPAGRKQRLPVPPARDEVRRLGETLNDLLARLERALDRERAFVADASHQLRTPLTVLKTGLELALRRPKEAADLRAALTSAAEETDRLTALANDLLVIASADQGRLAIRHESLAIDELFATVAGRFSGGVGPDDHPTLELSPSPGLRVRADRLRLEEALGNVLDNALRYGGQPVRLSATATEAGVELHVTDHGPGFPPAFVPHAFERFSRAERAGDGSGLGLAIVDAIARAHGGRADATNASGAGADVVILLPRD
ncbi:MAG: HAMP domain-containing protein [Solirubrobacterales bacterium]|nr:HAMP domain-containing protein [Solirubrobacterales bacterium]